VQRQRIALIESAGHRTFDRRTARDTAGRGDVDGNARAIGPTSVEAADYQVALGNGIDVAVDPFQRRHQQAAATQALGVADGRNRDVDGLARLGERRQVRVNGNRRDVLQLDVATRRHLDAELRQHVVEGLHRERRLRGLVTAAVEADHQAVANQLVGPYAADG